MIYLYKVQNISAKQTMTKHEQRTPRVRAEYFYHRRAKQHHYKLLLGLYGL